MIRKAYDRSYYESPLFRTKGSCQRNRLRLALIRRQRPGGELLEIGSGKGHLLELAAAHYAVTGVEISEYAARSSPPAFQPRIITADVESIELPQAQYDVALAFNVLEHLQAPASMLGKLRRSLKPSGVCIGSVPLNYGPIGWLHTALTNVIDRTHRSTMSLDAWRRAFAESGFRRQDLFGEVQLGPNTALYLRNRLWPYLSLNLMFVLS